MITELGKRYAYLKGDVVAWIFTATDMPEFNEDHINAVVCGPTVQAGWLYANGIFSPPVAPIITLTTDQIQALTTAQIQALNTVQIQILATNQISALTTTQVQALTSAQITALTPMQAPALSKVFASK